MSEKERQRDKHWTLAYVCLFIALGLPVWWQTTSVYRAELPFQHIARWKNQQSLPLHVDLHIHLHIINSKQAHSIPNLSNQVQQQVNQLFASYVEPHFPQDEQPQDTEFIQNTMATVPKSLLQFTVDVTFSTLDDQVLSIGKEADWEERLQAHFKKPLDENGEYAIHIVCGKQGHGSGHVYMGQHRSAFIHLPHDLNQEHVSTIISPLIAGLFSEEQEDLLSLASVSSFNPFTKKKYEHDSMRTLKYSNVYQIIFSLLNGDDSTLLVDWDIQAAISSYFIPFIDAVSNVANFSVSARVLHYATLSIQPETIKNIELNKTIHTIRPDQLPLFINSAEWNLASISSSNPAINLILYVPSSLQTPLHILKSDGHVLDTNAFLIPRFGGVSIANPPEEILQVDQSNKQDGPTVPSWFLDADQLRKHMGVYIAQMRGLLGVKEIWTKGTSMLPPNIKIEAAVSHERGITAMELDRLTRKKTIGNIVDTVNTLGSLAVLIQQMENMVVKDNIALSVTESLNAIEKAASLLSPRNGINEDLESVSENDITMANQLARRAIHLAESAFFDPTMVSMLYFPTEHKYAVYMPFFVPALVPVFVSLIKHIIKRRKKQKAE